MTGFIAEVLPDDETPDPASEPIVNDGFFPDIDPVSFREQLRIRDSVTPARARDALIAAMLAVGRDLAAWSQAHRAAGIDRLADLPAPLIDATPVPVLLYRRAIFTAAKAEVVERYRDVDMTGDGNRKAADLEPSVGELRRDSLHAIRDLLGVSRTTIELI